MLLFLRHCSPFLRPVDQSLNVRLCGLASYDPRGTNSSQYNEDLWTQVLKRVGLKSDGTDDETRFIARRYVVRHHVFNLKFRFVHQ